MEIVSLQIKHWMMEVEDHFVLLNNNASTQCGAIRETFQFANANLPSLAEITTMEDV
jgi:hypothetical protein